MLIKGWAVGRVAAGAEGEGGHANRETMGAQQTKDRVIPAGSAVRQTRKQPRNPKESRLIGSNIFTEHSGQFYSFLFFLCFFFSDVYQFSNSTIRF